MAIKTKLHADFWAPLLALALLFSVSTLVSGQTSSPTPTSPNPPSANPPTSGQPVGPAPRWPNPPDDITRQEIVDMNHFLDEHPETAEQLRKDPSLIDNREWLAKHPELQQYLQSHPRISEAFRANPNLFMRDEDRYSQQQAEHNVTERDVADMSHFLNTHPEIDEQLRKDPSLIDNRQWVANHPELQEYLQKHPGVADEFRAHPVAFMQDEERYDREHDRNAGMNPGGEERNRGELTSFGQFLGGHSAVATELANDPSLANNKEYLANHPELDEYLKAHPTVSEQLAANPQAVMSSNVVVENGGFKAQPVGPTPKPKTNAPTPNQ
jgi:hypothetical protein